MRCMRSTHVSESTGSELTESGRNIWNCPGNITSWAYAGTSCASLRQIRGEASVRPCGALGNVSLTGKAVR